MTQAGSVAPPQASQPHDPELERAMKAVPQGAIALAGTAVILLLAAWLLMYLLVFLPRGPVS
jgi:hypothetical protein